MKHGYKSAARSLARLVDTNLGKDEVDWIYNAVIIMSWQQLVFDKPKFLKHVINMKDKIKL
jgi:hypothetical protein